MLRYGGVAEYRFARMAAIPVTLLYLALSMVDLSVASTKLHPSRSRDASTGEKVRKCPGSYGTDLMNVASLSSSSRKDSIAVSE